MKKIQGYRISYFSFFAFTCLVLIFISSCTQRTDNSGSETRDSVNNQSAADSAIDSVALKIGGGGRILVRAGEAIGRFQIKQEIEDAGIFGVLGKADSGDAAMCKSWSMWYLDKKAPVKEFDVYAACDPDLDMKKSIKILRLAHVRFSMENGISNNSSVNQLKETFPEALILEKLESSSSEFITLIDDVSSGVAFEITDNKIAAVLIHQPGEELMNTYLPFYKQN